MSKRISIAAVLALIATTVVATIAGSPVGAAPPVGSAVPAVAAIDWGECPEIGFEQNPGLDCAVVELPLDYDRPSGATTDVAIIRRPADDPELRQGSIFLNPGGPGGSGVEFVASAGDYLFTPGVRARFDLVGFDPRGIAYSAPLRCFETFDDLVDAQYTRVWPETRVEIAQWRRSDRLINNACRKAKPPIMRHMSTSNVARDLDQLRQAVGDADLNFVGYSYGSFLGATYAALYPDKVGAVVVDGVLDPIAWTTGRGNERWTVPRTTRLGSGAGAQATLEQFFELCDSVGPGDCAFAGDSAERFDALYARLQADPLELVFDTPDGTVTFVIDHQELVSVALGAMYNSPSWWYLGQDLAFVEAASLGLVPLGSAEATDLAARFAAFDEPYYGPEGFLGVACSDTLDPRNTNAWRRAARNGSGYFDALWTWADSPCARWPGEDGDRYLGPFDAATANTVLVANTVFDPATPYDGALVLHDLLPNSALLTVEGWGHTTPGLSACGDYIVATYLIERTVPAAEMTCAQDVYPFAPPPDPPDPLGGAAVDAGVDVRSALLDQATVGFP